MGGGDSNSTHYSLFVRFATSFYPTGDSSKWCLGSSSRRVATIQSIGLQFSFTTDVLFRLIANDSRKTMTSRKHQGGQRYFPMVAGVLLKDVSDYSGNGAAMRQRPLGAARLHVAAAVVCAVQTATPMSEQHSQLQDLLLRDTWQGGANETLVIIGEVICIIGDVICIIGEVICNTHGLGGDGVGVGGKQELRVGGGHLPTV